VSSGTLNSTIPYHTQVYSPFEKAAQLYHGLILHQFPILVAIRDFFIPPCIRRLLTGVHVGILSSRLGLKTRMVVLPDGKKNFEDMYNSLHTIPACDGRTDKHLSRA